MSEQWDGKVFMSTPGGPVVTMSLGDVLARKDAEIERLRAEGEKLRAENARLRAQVAEYFAEPGTHPVEREE